MSDSLTIDVDATTLLAALAQLGDDAERYVKAASKETAERIRAEARGRARRRTGTLIEAITVEEAEGPLGGYRVFVGPMNDPARRWGAGKRPENFPLWHEFGTRFMSAQPFLFASARLEAGPHMRRIADAIQAAIDAKGLGAA